MSYNQEFVVDNCVLMKYNGYDADVILPDGIMEINADAFANSYILESIIIPEGVVKIGRGAFYFCDKLKKVILPSSLEEIESRAFGCCNSLISIEVPENVKSIDSDAFMACSLLKCISVHVNNKYFYSENGVLLKKDENKVVLLSCPGGLEDTYALPENVTSIGDYAFYGCNNLTTLIISESVTEISHSAFCGTNNLKNIEFPKSFVGSDKKMFENYTVRAQVSREQKTSNNFFSTAEELLEWDRQFKESKTSTVFSRCERNVSGSYKIPEGIKKIESCAFYGCKNLTDIYIPDGVTYIDTNAFYGCSNLKAIRIPDSVTHIGNGAFEGCNKLYLIIGKSVLDPDPLCEIYKYGLNLDNAHIKIFNNTVKPVAFPKLKLRPYNYSKKWLMSLALGFLACPELYGPDEFDSSEQNSDERYYFIPYARYIKYNQSKLLEYIFDNDIPECLKYFAEYKGITLENFEKKFLLPARRKEAVKCEKYLLSVPVTAEKEKVALKNAKSRMCEPFSAESLGKEWTFMVYYNEGVEALGLTYYTGTDKDIIVPQMIDNRPVEILKARLLRYDTRCHIKSITIPRSVRKIESGLFAKHPDIVIRGCKNSYARSFALLNGLKFEELEVTT